VTADIEQQLRAALAQAQMTIQVQEGELHKLRQQLQQQTRLDPASKDAFRRPWRSGAQDMFRRPYRGG